MKTKTFNINASTEFNLDIENLQKLRLSSKSRKFILSGRYKTNMPVCYNILIKGLKRLSVDEIRRVLKINPEMLELLI